MEEAETWQPELPFAEREPLTVSCWEKALSERLGRKVKVTYNRARTVVETVESVLQQSHRNFEVTWLQST